MLSSLRSPSFQQSRPVLLTTFTNKVGSIGLSLISILLVKRGVSTGEGSLVLTTLKMTLLAGTLVGGALTDRFRSRTLVLTALLLSAFGLGLLPFPRSIWLILGLAVVAQFAEALMNVVQRLLLMDQVDFAHQREALGWLRMVNNFAQIFSFSVAALGAKLGVTPLMLFDSGTSLGAFFLGRRLLPTVNRRASGEGLSGAAKSNAPSPSAFYRCAVVLMGWSFMYELFLEGGAGRLEVLHPGEGLRRFSMMMIFNTVLCSAFAIKATRVFRHSWNAICGGVTLTAAGVMVAAWGMQSQGWVFGGNFLITLGELMVGAVSQYTLMRLTPGDRNSGFYYSTGLTLMQSGRILGAAAAFPLLIHAATLSRFMALIAAVLAALWAVLWSLKGEISRLA
jgi:MFS family permease